MVHRWNAACTESVTGLPMAVVALLAQRERDWFARTVLMSNVAETLSAVHLDSGRRHVVACLMSGMYQGEGLFLVQGDTGVGKSTLLRHVAVQLTGIHGVLLLGGDGIVCCRHGSTLSDIVGSFQSQLQFGSECAEPLHMARRLQDLAEGEQAPVLLLDDADVLATQVLRSIVSLTSLRARDRRVLSVVLTGNLGLDDLIRKVEGDGGMLSASRIFKLDPMLWDDTQPLARQTSLAARPSVPLARPEPINAVAAADADPANGSALTSRGVQTAKVVSTAQPGEGLAAAPSTLAAPDLAPTDRAAATAYPAHKLGSPTRDEASIRRASEVCSASDAINGDSDETATGRVRYGADASANVTTGDWNGALRKRRQNKRRIVAAATTVVLLGGIGWAFSANWSGRTERFTTSAWDANDDAISRNEGGGPPSAEKAEALPLDVKNLGIADTPSSSAGTGADVRPPVEPPLVPPGSVLSMQAQEEREAQVPDMMSVAGDSQEKASSVHPLDPSPPVQSPPESTMAQPMEKVARPAPSKPQVASKQPEKPATPSAPPEEKATSAAVVARRGAVPREVDVLLVQGDAALEAGDVTTARSAYEAAYDKGSAEGAMRLARTFDPRMAEKAAQASPAEAILWYKDAARRGDRKASAQLNELAEWLATAAANGNQEAGRVLEVWQRANAPQDNPVEGEEQ